MGSSKRALQLSCAVSAAVMAAAAQASAITISVNVTANRKAINPNVYGMAYASAAQISDLNIVNNRWGGNPASRYNWQKNCNNRGSDWYFESIADASATAGASADSFISDAKNNGAQAMMTIPTLNYVATVNADRSKKWSFSIAKYGAQTGSEGDAGNGVKSTGGNVTGNDPLDANVANSTAFELGWVQHIKTTFGAASAGGLKYYLMDNEPGLWQSTHRDVHPIGAHDTEVIQAIENYAAMVKGNDSGAVIVAPEEWGWTGFLYSGYDAWWAGTNGWANTPDKTAHGNLDYEAYLLQQLKAYDTANGKSSINVFSLHWYPQSGEFSDDVSTTQQNNRNKSTRSLWDPAYTDVSWIASVVQLIPRMKSWVSTYYPGLQTAITEYNWGAEGHINGATAQADVLGIFGREGLDMAARWTTPATGSPCYNSIKMYRNYDGTKKTFGDVSVSCTVPNADQTAAFAAQRTSDSAVTVMVINKVTTATPVTINIANFTAGATAKRYQLTSSNVITNLADIAVSAGAINDTAPAQSITLYVVAAGGGTPTFTGTATATPSTLAAGAVTAIVASFKDTGAALTNGIADIEVYDAAGTKVGQQAWTGQNWTTNQTLQFTYNFTAPATAGTYTVRLGVDTANWATLLFWNNAAATITDTGASDPAQYNFEAGTQSWTVGGAPITAVASSTTQHFAGTHSLAVTINGAAGTNQVVIANPTTAAGKVVTFHVWVPSGSQITGVQPFVQQGAGGAWLWTGTFKAIGTLTTNAWNTITVTVPSNAVTPLSQLGVQFVTGATWSGTCYVDAVSWP
jgi:hypothetical protein